MISLSALLRRIRDEEAKGRSVLVRHTTDYTYLQFPDMVSIREIRRMVRPDKNGSSPPPLSGDKVSAGRSVRGGCHRLARW